MFKRIDIPLETETRFVHTCHENSDVLKSFHMTPNIRNIITAFTFKNMHLCNLFIFLKKNFYVVWRYTDSVYIHFYLIFGSLIKINTANKRYTVLLPYIFRRCSLVWRPTPSQKDASYQIKPSKPKFLGIPEIHSWVNHYLWYNLYMYTIYKTFLNPGAYIEMIWKCQITLIIRGLERVAESLEYGDASPLQ